MLHAKAEHGHGGSSVSLGNAIAAARKDQDVGAITWPVLQFFPGWLKYGLLMLSEGSIGCAGGHAEDVVALHALEEGSEAAAENGLAVSEEIFREADARLQVSCSRW